MDVAVHFQITDLEIRYRLLRKQAVVHTAPCKPVALPNPYRLQYLFLLMRAGWLKRTHLPCFTILYVKFLYEGTNSRGRAFRTKMAPTGHAA